MSSRFSMVVYVMLDWVARVVYMNLLWWVFVLAGGVVLGVFPSCLALLIAARRGLKGEFGSTLPHMFAEAFKSHFWRANILGFSTAAIVAVGHVDYALLATNADPVATAARILLVATTILAIVWSPFAWAACARFERVDRRVLRWSFFALASSPFRSTCTLVAFGIVLFLLCLAPAVLFAIGPAALAMTLMGVGDMTMKHARLPPLP